MKTRIEKRRETWARQRLHLVSTPWSNPSDFKSDLLQRERIVSWSTKYCYKVLGVLGDWIHCEGHEASPASSVCENDWSPKERLGCSGISQWSATKYKAQNDYQTAAIHDHRARQSGNCSAHNLLLEAYVFRELRTDALEASFENGLPQQDA